MIAEDGVMVAGYMSFTALMAFFPFLIFLAALVSFIGTQEDVDRILSVLFENVPAKIAQALEPVVHEVIVGRKSGFLTFGAVTAIWAASNGVEALRLALNRAYQVKTLRPVWKRRIQSLFFVFLAALLAFLMSVLIVLGPLLWRWANAILDLSPIYGFVWLAGRYLLASMVLLLSLASLHRWLPNRAQSYRQVWPGVIFTLLFFVVTGSGFSLYLGNFADYSVTYGGMAGFVIALLFFYATSLVFILGAYLNCEIQNERSTD